MKKRAPKRSGSNSNLKSQQSNDNLPEQSPEQQMMEDRFLTFDYTKKPEPMARKQGKGVYEEKCEAPTTDNKVRASFILYILVTSYRTNKKWQSFKNPVSKSGSGPNVASSIDDGNSDHVLLTSNAKAASSPPSASP